MNPSIPPIGCPSQRASRPDVFVIRVVGVLPESFDPMKGTDVRGHSNHADDRPTAVMSVVAKPW